MKAPQVSSPAGGLNSLCRPARPWRHFFVAMALKALQFLVFCAVALFGGLAMILALTPWIDR